MNFPSLCLLDKSDIINNTKEIHPFTQVSVLGGDCRNGSCWSQSCRSSSYSAPLIIDVNVVRWEIIAVPGRGGSRQVRETKGVQNLCWHCIWQKSFSQRGRHQKEEENWPYQLQGSLLFSGLKGKKEILEIIDGSFGQGGVLWYFLKSSHALPGLFHHQVRIKIKASIKWLLKKSVLVEVGSVDGIRQLWEQTTGVQRNTFPQGGHDCLVVLVSPWWAV